jgi:hypothetical protein
LQPVHLRERRVNVFFLDVPRRLDLLQALPDKVRVVVLLFGLVRLRSTVTDF